MVSQLTRRMFVCRISVSVKFYEVKKIRWPSTKGIPINYWNIGSLANGVTSKCFRVWWCRENIKICTSALFWRNKLKVKTCLKKKKNSYYVLSSDRKIYLEKTTWDRNQFYVLTIPAYYQCSTGLFRYTKQIYATVKSYTQIYGYYSFNNDNSEFNSGLEDHFKTNQL